MTPAAPESHIACLAHMIVRARQAVQEAQDALSAAEARANAEGLSLASLNGALGFLMADPHALEQEQREVGFVLLALRAPGVDIDRVEVTTHLTDEPPANRTARAHKRGWIAAVLNGACEPPYPAATAEHFAYREGYALFRSEFRAFERTSAPPRRARVKEGA